jgi:hypothetical protein
LLERVEDAEDAGAAKALQSDPLLPERLLSAEYLGRRAWERRKTVLARTGERLRTFAP